MRFLASNPMSSTLRICYHGLRLAIGALFVYSGVLKVGDPLGTADSVRNYELIGDPWITAVALLLPWVEIIAGALLLTGLWLPGALAVVAGSSLVFLIAIGSAWGRGLNIECGCFGAVGEGPSSYGWHMVLLVVLLAACGWLWRQTQAKHPQSR